MAARCAPPPESRPVLLAALSSFQIKMWKERKEMRKCRMDGKIKGSRSWPFSWVYWKDWKAWNQTSLGLNHEASHSTSQDIIFLRNKMEIITPSHRIWTDQRSDPSFTPDIGRETEPGLGKKKQHLLSVCCVPAVRFDLGNICEMPGV